MANEASSIGTFLWQRKRYWLLPLALVLGVFALLVLLSIGGEGNFVYTLD